MDVYDALKSSIQCKGCSNLRVFRRKQCFCCKNYFCQVCIIRRPDQKKCCRKCQILTATPLDKNDLLNLRSRDLVNYLASRHISTSGCVEKEDLVNVLMRAVNNSSSSSNITVNDRHFNDDGIRIVGTDVTDDEGSCSSASLVCDAEVLNCPDEVAENEIHAEDAERAEEVPDNNEGVSLNSAEPEVQNSNPSQRSEVDAKEERVNKPLKLSDISCSADLDNLSVKELKMLLMTNRTDFKGCVERAELIEKASRLWSDYTLSRKDLEKISLEELCKICMDAPIECVLLECGHLATCMPCGKQLSECPVCRQYVVRCVRTFKV